ncbi:glutathione S-transferase N-terminal domain-containing protein [Raoultibacter phocaeensis]|uniref:glutathione S-transferase N-terminal domain-containing protein n=1 Tax=Raoultibacter phocaeensis TaxID=2479841 RepID=UPI0011196012|nr:glutathione S-transferase N-terminal domain-containing protein [Raoultibacter phocaeensis]
MDKPILYYWAPCETCSVVVNFANEHDIELDKRDVEQEEPYQELLELGGNADLIPYLYDDGQLVNGNDAVIEYLTRKFL